MNGPNRIDTSKARLVACAGGPLDGDAIVTPLTTKHGEHSFRVTALSTPGGTPMHARYTLDGDPAAAACWRFSGWVSESPEC